MPQLPLLVLGAAVALALVSGCNGTQELIEQPEGPSQSVVSETEGVRLTLTSDKPEYDPGEPVELTFEVENASGVKRTVEFSSGCQLDFLVQQAGKLVWNAGHDRMCAQVLTSFELGPGGIWTRSGVWDQRSNKDEPVGPGTYDVTARLLRAAAPLESDSLKIVVR